jgi:hypothetical protein
MLRPAYLSQKRDRPPPDQDGGRLRTVLGARTYMFGLSNILRVDPPLRWLPGIGHEGLYVTRLPDHAMGWRKRADEFADMCVS